MSKKITEMSYTELLAEQERVEIALAFSKSLFLSRDYKRYLAKIKQLIKDYEKLWYN